MSSYCRQYDPLVRWGPTVVSDTFRRSYVETLSLQTGSRTLLSLRNVRVENPEEDDPWTHKVRVTRLRQSYMSFPEPGSLVCFPERETPARGVESIVITVLACRSEWQSLSQTLMSPLL